MKEATGELNMTVVIVIAVASLAAFFYTIIWPAISNNFHSNAKCADAICTCNNDNNKCEMVECYVVKCERKNDGTEECEQDGATFQCPWKG